MPTEKKIILIIGDVMIDSYHFGLVNRISPEAPVPIFNEKNYKRYAPGGAANVAVNIAAIGVPTAIVSVVGDDEYGRILKDSLDLNNIDTSWLTIRDNYRTTSKLRYIGQGNQQILRVDNEDISPVALSVMKPALNNIEKKIDEIGLIVLSDYMKGLLTEEIVRFVIKIADEHSIPVVADIKDKNYYKYSGATLLKPNKKELSEMIGGPTDTLEEVVEAAKQLCCNAKSEYVLATRGADGMILVNSDELICNISSVAKEVYDVTGAGDTTLAYLAAELFKGTRIEKAMQIANYAAGLQVSKFGTSLVPPEEVYKAMRQSMPDHERKIIDSNVPNGLDIIKQLKKEGKTIVFTNGCFDVLHAGHVTCLKKAKELGNVLIVGINDDESVRRLKGKERPINTLADRQLLLAEMECVDYVISFDEDTPINLINAILPDVLVKGGDYKVENIVGAKEVIENGGKVEIIPLVKGKSSSNIINSLNY